MEQYNKNLPKDSNNNITVSATTKEEGNKLYIDLKAIPTSDNFDFQVDSFGNYEVINNKTNIFLIDRNFYLLSIYIVYSCKYEIIFTKQINKKAKIDLAKKYNGIVVNADSLQVYKELDIATAKIKEEEKEGIPHYLFDIVDKNDMYTVYDYQKEGRNKRRSRRQRERKQGTSRRIRRR